MQNSAFYKGKHRRFRACPKLGIFTTRQLLAIQRIRPGIQKGWAGSFGSPGWPLRITWPGRPFGSPALLVAFGSPGRALRITWPLRPRPLRIAWLVPSDRLAGPFGSPGLASPFGSLALSVALDRFPSPFRLPGQALRITWPRRPFGSPALLVASDRLPALSDRLAGPFGSPGPFGRGPFGSLGRPLRIASSARH